MSGHGAARRFTVALAGLVLVIATAPGCQKDPSRAVYVPTGGVEFTNPTDGEALNARVINVRGTASVGTLVKVYVDGEPVGSAVAYTSEDFGRFAMEDVDLGAEEGRKTLVAVATDGAGHEADRGDTITITLDVTPPPAVLGSIDGAAPDETGELWLAPFAQFLVRGRTDTTAGVVRVREEPGLSYFTPSSADTYPSGTGGHDSVRVEIEVRRPNFGPTQVESLIVYSFEALDAAENYTQDLFTVQWLADTTACTFENAVNILMYEMTHYSDTLHTQVYALPVAVDRGETICSLDHLEQYTPTIDRSWFFFIDWHCDEAYPHRCTYLFIDVEFCYNRDGFGGSWPPERLEQMVPVASWQCQ